MIYSSILSLWTTIFIAIPFGIYLNNSNIFVVGLFELMAISILLFVIFSCISIYLCSKILVEKRDFINRMFLFINLLFLIQTTIIIYAYPSFIGDINSIYNFNYMWKYELIIFISLLIFCYKINNRFVLPMGRAILLSQVFYIFMLLFLHIKDINIFYNRYDDNSTILVSTKKNIDLIFVDTLQSSSAIKSIEALRQNEKNADITVFTNFLANYAVTRLSIPSALGGAPYLNEIGYHKYLNKIYRNSDSVFSIAKDNNCSVQLIRWSYMTPIPTDKSLYSNASTSLFSLNKSVLDSIYLLYKIYQFNLSPQFIKENLSIFFNSFQSKLNEGIFESSVNNQREKILTNSCVIRIIHDKGLHIPLEDNSHENSKYQIKVESTLKNIFEFYKNISFEYKVDSDILIMGDHGAGLQNFALDDYRDRATGNYANTPQENTANPAFIIASLNEGSYKITYDDKPFELINLNCIVKALISSDKISTCANYGDRRFYYSRDASLNPLTDRFNNIYSFVISGDLRLKSSWNIEKFYFNRHNGLPTPNYFPPVKDLFKINDLDFRARNFGWGVPGDGFTWSSGYQSDLLIPVKEGITYDLVVKLTPLVQKGVLERQRVKVSIKGQEIADWNVETPGSYRAIIPASLTKNGSISLVFSYPNATSLKKLGLSNDSEILAVQFSRLNMSQL
jgi:hypothetical protein